MFHVQNNTQRVQVSGSTNFTYNGIFLIITNFYLIVHVSKDLNPYGTCFTSKILPKECKFLGQPILLTMEFFYNYQFLHNSTCF